MAPPCPIGFIRYGFSSGRFSFFPHCLLKILCSARLRDARVNLSDTLVCGRALMSDNIFAGGGIPIPARARTAPVRFFCGWRIRMPRSKHASIFSQWGGNKSDCFSHLTTRVRILFCIPAVRRMVVA